jgi:O-antigen ligase
MLTVAVILMFLALAILLIVRPRSAIVLVLGVWILFYPFLFQTNMGIFSIAVGGANVYLTDLLTALLFVFVCTRILFRGIPFTPGSTRLILVFSAWGVIGIVRGVAAHGYSAVGEARLYVFPILYYLSIVAAFRTKEQIRGLARWFLPFLAVMVLYNAIDYYFLGGMARAPYHDYRTPFRFIPASQTALVVFGLIAVLLSYVIGVWKKRHLLAYLTLGGLAAIIVVTQHRSVWLAAAIGLAAAGSLAAMWFVWKKLPVQTIFMLNAVPVLLIVGALAAGVLRGDIYEHVLQSASFFEDPTQDPTGAWRLTGWQQEMEKAMQHPLFGEGFGGYSQWFDGYKWLRVWVHNGYIMYFSKLGAAGMLLLLGLIICWFVEMCKYGNRERDRYYRWLGYALQACVLAHLVYAFFFEFTVFFWILLAAGTVLVREQRRHLRAAIPPGERTYPPGIQAARV